MRKILVTLAALSMSSAILAATPERYLHVRVDSANANERVRVNIPLSLAEKVIPAIHARQLNNGMVQIGSFQANDVDLPAILNAVKSAPDGVFVTVQKPGTDVRVAKEHGQLIVHVMDRKDDTRVDVTIPWSVAEALTSQTNAHQLNVEAALEALDRAGDVTLVTARDSHSQQTVRVWVDSHNTAD